MERERQCVYVCVSVHCVWNPELCQIMNKATTKQIFIIGYNTVCSTIREIFLMSNTMHYGYKLHHYLQPHLQVFYVSLYRFNFDPWWRRLGDLICGVGYPHQQLSKSIVKLSQLQQSIFESMLSSQSIRVEFGPHGVQLLQLLRDKGAILSRTVLFEFFALSQDRSYSGLQVCQ